MKTCLIFAGLAMTLAAAGCAFNQHSLLLEPVGPPVAQSASPVHDGTLMVYSAFDVHEPGSYEHRRHYSDYRIYALDGKLLRRVHNDTDTVVEEPVAVELAPGKYRIVADSNGYGEVTVPVVVAAHHTTTVHLEGETTSSDLIGLAPANAVHLPGGETVGYRAGLAN